MARWLLERSTMRVSRWILLLALVVAGFGYWAWQRGAPHRAIEAMPPEQRAGLFVRTLANARSCTGDLGKELSQFCEGQADLLLAFPECDRDCRELARAVLTRPTR